jgi:hypothetical protein
MLHTANPFSTACFVKRRFSGIRHPARACPLRHYVRQSMIPKSGNRFSDKIMLKRKI